MDVNEIKEAKSLYNALIGLAKEKADLEVLKKQREETLKFEIAGEADLKDKDGNPEPKKVKMPLVSAVLDELYKDKENKKATEYEIMQEYKGLIKNKRVNENTVTDYLSVLAEIESNKEDTKACFADCTVITKDVMDAVDAIVKEEYKAIKDDAMENAGYEVKPAKDNSEKLSLIEEVKKAILK